VRVCARVFHRVASESRTATAAKNDDETDLIMIVMTTIDDARLL